MSIPYTFGCLTGGAADAKYIGDLNEIHFNFTMRFPYKIDHISRFLAEMHDLEKYQTKLDALGNGMHYDFTMGFPYEIDHISTYHKNVV